MPTDSPDRGPVHYAIGDVHGERDRLAALHERIAAFHERFHAGRARVVVHLGDYVDRGPDSCGVIDLILQLQQQAAGRDDLQVIALLGNHEQMMLDAGHGAREMEFWGFNGGVETMESYARAGRLPAGGHADPAHLSWLETLPDIWTAHDGRLIFVHAGIEPDIYPEEGRETRLWTRSERFFASQSWTNPRLDGALVIHGHTPLRDASPEISSDGRRVNVDTACVYGGRLTCAVVSAPDAPVRFFSV
jgi:serine/threonine protein phosphatase 1